jgi:uncharacterized alkaline shock family protein YloU
MPTGGLLSNAKKDFMSPDAIAAQQRREHEEAQSQIKRDANKADAQINGLNSALSGDATAKTEAEIKSLEKYTKEDLKMAEELIFRGYAERDVEIIPGAKATIASMSAAEVELVNEMIYEYANNIEKADAANKDKSESSGVSVKVIDGLQQMLFVSLGFKGFNGKDISPSTSRTLQMIKSGVRKMTDCEIDGDIAAFKEIRKELKKTIWARAAELKRMPVSITDSISKKRYDLEKMIFDLTSRDDLLPKF